MDKFIYLFRGGNASAQTESVHKDQMQKWTKWMESLGAKGSFVGGDPLLPIGKQVSGSKKITTSISSSETQELASGYIIINANDMSEAVEISKGCPILDLEGIVEIRPIQKMTM